MDPINWAHMTIYTVRRPCGTQRNRLAVLGVLITGNDIWKIVAAGKFGIRVTTATHGYHLAGIA